jgi:hypothetical protein
MMQARGKFDWKKKGAVVSKLYIFFNFQFFLFLKKLELILFFSGFPILPDIWIGIFKK